MLDPTYNVYSICEGAIESDIYNGDNFNTALEAFSAYVKHESSITSRDYELTVHLYEPIAGIMHSETCIPRTH